MTAKLWVSFECTDIIRRFIISSFTYPRLPKHNTMCLCYTVKLGYNELGYNELGC
jgi:hypothetical protein